MDAIQAAAFVRETVLATGIPGVSRAAIERWFDRNGRNLEAQVGALLGRWLTPVTTPRTRVSYGTLREWLDGLYELQDRPPASKKYEDIKRHLEMLTEGIIATGSPDDLAEAAALFRLRTGDRSVMQPRGRRADDVVTRLTDAVDRQVARLRKADEKVAPPEPTLPTASLVEAPPDLWTPKQRTAANLAAMRLLAQRIPARDLTPEQRRVLASYSGWGGLSIADARPSFPEGIPLPDERGLIHEYYTPTRVAMEISRIVQERLGTLPRNEDGRVSALEPSAGIGRFVRSLWNPDVAWTIVEYSELSALLLGSLLRSPGVSVDVWQGPFERWIRENETKAPPFGLVVSNPPYGQRGPSKVEDANRAYREDKAYAYFLRRSADLLQPGGLGVYVIPSGFMSAKGVDARRLRELVLRRHHLAAAFRLPSKTFPGAMLVVDVVLLRARGGELATPEPGDDAVLAGDYFRLTPEHILGTEVGDATEAEGDRDRPKARWGYQVEGTFDRFPAFVERPLCQSCAIQPFGPTRAQGRRQGGIRTTAEDRLVEGLVPVLAEAVRLGLRLDRYLAERAAGTALAVELHVELLDAVRSWAAKYGNPWASVEVQKLAKEGNTGVERFLSVFERSGRLQDAIQVAPVFTPSYGGPADDVLAQADHLWRTRTTPPTTADVVAFAADRGATLEPADVEERLQAGRWFRDRGTWIPASVYLTGSLWDRYDRAVAEGLQEQATALLRVIRPASYEDIETITPQAKWIPLDLTAEWLGATLNKQYGKPELKYEQGLVLPTAARELSEAEDVYGLSAETLWCIGWINHDRTMFRPRHRKEEDIDEVRKAWAKQWTSSFVAWINAKAERRAIVETAYQRTMQGWVAPSYGAEPLSIARWGADAPTPHPHQTAGARRVLENRGGLVAFDVGVGKTFTGLQVLARARQEGWSRRPILLVPNSIAVKWYNDIKRCLPDYRVGMVGAKFVKIARGPRAGLETTDIDTPEERSATWSKFQAGEYEVVIVTYSAFARTRMNEGPILEYANATAAIQRELALRKRSAAETKKPTERQQAIMREGMAAWVAEQMELPEGWQYDPGLAWDDIGVDLCIVDEAQNFKNLYLPEPREGGVPRFMGSAGEGSKRAWQLDFRLASVRRKARRGGVVLLSATPAKNSPLEFYNLVQYVDHDVWTQRGIPDPESFIDRFCKIETRDVLDSSLSVTQRAACVGFINLHELRDVVFRIGEFKTAEDVGLKLPEPKVNLVEVDMDDVQEAKYDALVRSIEKAMESRDPSDKAKILGFLARMSLVSIHANLDEVNEGTIVTDDDGKKKKIVDRGRRARFIEDADPHSPKFDELARRIMASPGCGHIVFVDNLAAHDWIRRVLVEAGLKAERIGLLNAEAAKSAADRQRVAQDFNGDAERGVSPKYDVVICNAVAYEGIDLQTRTCAIHHVDLPWEPATLQQRNGRGVRQGNTLATIEINYYFASRSMDGQRFDLIRNKQGWMSALLTSQARDTNNPAAQSDMSPEEVLVLISRDPNKTRARLAELRAKREEETRRKVAEEAVRVARSAQARFRKAERTADPEEASIIRGEAEARLNDLAKMDPEAWPWAAWAVPMRSQPLVVPDTGPPVHEGLRFMVPRPHPLPSSYLEVGNVEEPGKVWIRKLGEPGFTAYDLTHLTAAEFAKAEAPAGWPEDDAKLEQLLLERVNAQLRWGNWDGMKWHGASDVFRVRWWTTIEQRVIRTLGAVGPGGMVRLVPVAAGTHVAILDEHYRIPTDAELIPPTDRGWIDYLARAPGSGLTWTELDKCAWWWWKRHIPLNLLAAAKRAA